MARPVLQMNGVPELRERMRRASSSPEYRRILRGALREGIGIVSRAQKAAVPKGLADVRTALGSRLLKDSRQGFGAKAGAGVGKSSVQRTERRLAKQGPRGGRGVGISARNIHWYVMGTAARMTGSKRVGSRKRGDRMPTGGAVHSTGRMPAHLFIKAATLGVLASATAVMRQQVWAGLRALWATGK